MPIVAVELPEISLPVSTTSERLVVAEEKETNGLKITEFDLAGDALVGEVIWAPAGDAFFTLSNSGVLRRITMIGRQFNEERQLDLARRASWMAVSAVGLLIAMNDLQETWVINPVSLELLKRIPSPNINRILSGPGLIFALSAGQSQGGTGGQSVVYLDLEAGVSVHQQNVPIQFARLTPDGKYYFAQGGTEQLMQFRVVDRALVAEQSTERIAQNGQNIFVSSDSKYVCLPSGGGNYGASGYATFIYPVNNLKKPEFTLESGAYPRSVGFDSAAHLVYAQNHGTPLIVYSDTGIKKAEYNIPLTKNRILREPQFVVHPTGKKILMTSDNTLVFVELP
jgi:hypothetical protein